MKWRASVLYGAEINACSAGVGRLTLETKRHQQPAVRRELMRDVSQIIGAVDRIVRPNRDAVRPSEEPFTPRSEKVAVAIEHDNRVFAAIEDEHAILRVSGNAGDFGPGNLSRQPMPAIVGLVPVSAAIGYCHSHS